MSSSLILPLEQNGSTMLVAPLAIHANGNAAHRSPVSNGKRKDHDDGGTLALLRSGCSHLPSREDAAGLRDLLHATIRRARQSTSHSTVSLGNRHGTQNASWWGERVCCLMCDFTGVREDLDDSTKCFMTHSFLENHHLALMPRKKQLYCARCLDFVHPDELLALTHHSTPHHRHHSHRDAVAVASRHQQLTHRHRTPSLRRRLMRSSARRGLVNMGNTCYMNAVLQALAHNPLFQHEYFIVRGHNTTICEQRRRHDARCVQPHDHPGSVTQIELCMGCEMASLMQTLFPAPRATLTARHLTSPFVPQSFMETFWSAAPSFVGSQQQDAHEFLVALLNSIHSSTCSRSPFISKISSKQDDPLQSPRFTPSGRSLCDCVVHQNFAGVFNSEISCVFCDTVSSKFDPFLDITLSLETSATTPRKSSTAVPKNPQNPDPNYTLTSLLRRFTLEERLKGQDMVYCLRCSRYVDAIKRLVLHKLPNLLVFHLGRFDFAKNRKIVDPVSFPLRGLDLREFCSELDTPMEISTPVASRSRKDALTTDASSGRSSPLTPPPPTVAPDAVYDLAAVISHHGDSVEGGHFTAFVHSSQDSTDSESISISSNCSWLHFDDSTVQRVAAEEVEASQAYLLFYVRRHLFV